MKNEESKLKLMVKMGKDLGITPFYVDFKRKSPINYGNVSEYQGNPLITLYGVEDTDFIYVVLHEFGHIKYKHYKIANHSVTQEYKAEKWALSKMKKLFPEVYNKRLIQLKLCVGSIDWCMAYPFHAEAFKKILRENNDW